MTPRRRWLGIRRSFLFGQILTCQSVSSKDCRRNKFWALCSALGTFLASRPLWPVDHCRAREAWRRLHIIFRARATRGHETSSPTRTRARVADRLLLVFFLPNIKPPMRSLGRPCRSLRTCPMPNPPRSKQDTCEKHGGTPLAHLASGVTLPTIYNRSIQ